MSGSFVFRKGVGTQMLTVSRVEMTAKSVIAVRRPAAVSSATVVDATSGTYEAPLRIVATLRSSRSIPVVLNPLRANSTASGNPTYPRPTTPTRARRDFRRSNKRTARADIDILRDLRVDDSPY